MNPTPLGMIAFFNMLMGAEVKCAEGEGTLKGLSYANGEYVLILDVASDPLDLCVPFVPEITNFETGKYGYFITFGQEHFKFTLEDPDKIHY